MNEPKSHVRRFYHIKCNFKYSIIAVDPSDHSPVVFGDYSLHS